MLLHRPYIFSLSGIDVFSLSLIFSAVLIVGFIIEAFIKPSTPWSRLSYFGVASGISSLFCLILFLGLAFPVATAVYGSPGTLTLVRYAWNDNIPVVVSVGELSLPGPVLAIAAILFGSLAYWKRRTFRSSVGAAFGAAGLILYILAFPLVGGTPYLCINNNVCNDTTGESCISYSTKLIWGSLEAGDIAHPGSCGYQDSPPSGVEG